MMDPTKNDNEHLNTAEFSANAVIAVFSFAAISGVAAWALLSDPLAPVAVIAAMLVGRQVVAWYAKGKSA
jgi:hypothetical protein